MGLIAFIVGFTELSQCFLQTNFEGLFCLCSTEGVQGLITMFVMLVLI